MPMPSRIAYPLAATALATAFLLTACGDEVAEINANVGAIKSTPPKNPNK